jgi:probable rRNA maturation factor
LACPDGELSILIVDDDEIARLNQTYLDRSGPTNVISFSMQEGPFSEINPNLLGDVVISPETAQREALAVGIDLGHRMDQLLVHGVLHLFGYDHEGPVQAADIMKEKEEELLELL